MAVAPLKSNLKGPSPRAPPSENPDLVDEALDYFKANILFRNYEPRGAGDRVLIYLTLYISKCLLKVANKSKGEAEQLLYATAIENFSLPGEKSFPLGGFVTPPANKQDADFVRQFLTQLRQETGLRLVELIYKRDQVKPDKWWMCFNKRKFLNMEL